MAEDRSSAPRSQASGSASVLNSSSSIRQRPSPRASTLNDMSGPPGRRRSSILSDSIDGTQQSIRSSTDDLLLPKAQGRRLETDEEPSHWHSAPLALALLPAVGGLLFKDGSAVVTDVTLLGLAAVFLNWSVRVPWDWYTSAQSIRVHNLEASDDLNPSNAIIEESSENEDENEASSPNSKSQQSSLLKDPKSKHGRSTGPDAAAKELRIHELLALFSCFLFPILGAWLLHAIRGKLSRPSEGLVSNYNLAIFLLASELRPLIHLIKLGQSRTLHLQRLANANSYGDEQMDKGQMPDLSKRLEELEAHVAAGTETTANGSSTKPTAQVTAEVRRTLQPDLDALNRAVRRYEKRATILTMQTESRLQDLEARMNDAITLAAAAERSNHSQRQGFSAILVNWLFAAMVLAIQALWEFASLPARLSSKAMSVAKGYVGGRVEKEMRTAGRHSEPGRMAGSRIPGRGTKKAT